MVWFATSRLDVLKLAVVMPPLVLSVPWPMLAAPSEKIISPVGLPVPPAITVAVKGTFWPHTDGVAELTPAVQELALPSLCVTVAQLLRQLLSPPADSVRTWQPTVGLHGLKAAA